MPQVTVNGQKFYSNNAIPRKGRTKAKIEAMKANKELIPWVERPRAPRKPNPHKGQKCALWVDKDLKVSKPAGIEASIVPKKKDKPRIYKYLTNPQGPAPKWSEKDIEEYRKWSKKQKAKKK